MGAGYGPTVVKAWLQEGACYEYEVKYQAFAMHEMTQKHIQALFAKLQIDTSVQEILVERAKTCKFTPFVEDDANEEMEEEEQEEEEEEQFDTGCTFLM